VHRLIWLLALAILVSGCSGTKLPERGKLAGKVTLDGKPVAKGMIRLMALDPNGLNAGTEIVSGEYNFPEGQGPAKGKYRAEFSVLSGQKKRVPNDDVPGQFMEVEAETPLPPRFHRESNIIVDYDPAKPEPRDFQLTSQ